jgi:hypothetical protein
MGDPALRGRAQQALSANETLNVVVRTSRRLEVARREHTGELL